MLLYVGFIGNYSACGQTFLVQKLKIFWSLLSFCFPSGISGLLMVRENILLVAGLSSSKFNACTLIFVVI